MVLKSIAVDRINPVPWNPRRDLQPGDTDYERLVRSIDDFGLVEPLVWNRQTGNLVGGHQRLKVLVARGVTEVDVSVVDLPPEREKALSLALNKIQGEWDDRKLATLLEELTTIPHFDLETTGFDLPEMTELLDRLLEGNDTGEDAFDSDGELQRIEKPKTQRGDLIQLGPHQLLCGDSTNPDDMARLMGDRRAALFATDPPYLVGYDGRNRPHGPKDWRGTYREFDWDKKRPEEAVEFFRSFLRLGLAHTIENVPLYVWHASAMYSVLEQALRAEGLHVHQQIIWVKPAPVIGFCYYNYQHEPCVLCWPTGGKPRRLQRASKGSTVWHVDWQGSARPERIGPEATSHPTQKPVELFAIPMRYHTVRGDVCYEPFAGSGSQLIAAEKLGRVCYAMELEPAYCDLTVGRYARYVGWEKMPEDLCRKYQPAGPTPGAVEEAAHGDR
jgi:DNA modification methylase